MIKEGQLHFSTNWRETLTSLYSTQLHRHYNARLAVASNWRAFYGILSRMKSSGTIKYIAVIATGILALLFIMAFDIHLEGGSWPHKVSELSTDGYQLCKAQLLVESNWEENNDKNRAWFEKSYKELLEIDPTAKVEVYRPLSLPKFTQAVRRNCIRQNPEWSDSWTEWELPQVVFGRT